MDGNPEVDRRLKDLEERMTAQALALYTVIWTISRIDPEAGDRIMASLDRMSDHLKSGTGRANGPGVLAEMAKLQGSLRQAFAAQRPRQG